MIWGLMKGFHPDGGEGVGRIGPLLSIIERIADFEDSSVGRRILKTACMV